MKTIGKWLAVSGSLALIILATACTKDNSPSSTIPPGHSKMSIYINDGPISYYKVMIDIRQVAVLVDTANHQNAPDDDDQWNPGFCGHERGQNNKSLIWDTLSIKPGVYNLLQLRNGADTLLGSGTYPSGKVIKVRITLGSDNAVFTDSLTSYPLVVFGFHPYFDINVRRENVHNISNNDFQLWLDFNLHRSIFFWSGTFYLKPYVVAYNKVKLSKIQGLVYPHAAAPLVGAIKGTDTLYTIPGWGGYYQFVGITSGTYSLVFYGHNGYNDTTINNIVVDSSSVINAPTITLHK
ncbi:MAG: DUF4382 domain-containing protein [Bacteroidetes bacterium]|nr:DUF4382 domain-containing protein [Bacteroidota bacterium]MBS1974548.1 DUF4382 domain-containing protein [Bacteroidota bacterium]